MSNSQRHPKRPKISYRKRSEIDTNMYSKIDAFLKDLRACAQRLAPVLSTLEDEMLILDRLYYKGSNQHRSALFWRKVEEMRRFSKRVLELQLGELIHSTRYAFYVVEDVERHPKLLKGSWVQTPEHDYVTFLSNRVQGSMILLDKARTRLHKAYESFILIMQTGAFVQLIVTITAIVSRLNALMGEIQPVLDTLRTALTSLDLVLKTSCVSQLSAVGPPAEEMSGSTLKADDVTCFSRIVRVDTSVQAAEASRTVSLDTLEALTMPLHTNEGQTMTTSLEGEAVHEQTPSEDVSTSRTTFVAQSTVTTDPEQGIITSSSVSHIAGTEPSKKADKKKMKTDAPSASSKAKVKKKRPRDEIDDIFGAL